MGQQQQAGTTGNGDGDRTEAMAALRKALGLERLLGRLRPDPDAPVASMPRPRRAPVPTQDHAHAAA